MENMIYIILGLLLTIFTLTYYLFYIYIDMKENKKDMYFYKDLCYKFQEQNGKLEKHIIKQEELLKKAQLLLNNNNINIKRNKI